MTGGIDADAMNSAPCPQCEDNQNGMFSQWYGQRWYCLKCQTRFDGPTPEQLQQRRCQTVDYWQHRHSRPRMAGTARYGLRIEERAASREQTFRAFEEVLSA